MTPTLALSVYVALALLYWWSRDRTREHAAKVKERQDNCPHPPEAQETMRTSNIITMNAALLHRVIPGRRHLTKHCRACKKQWLMYSPTLQPWDEFVNEFNQETRDRQVQYRARERHHMADEAEKERRRLEQRNRTEQS